MENERGYFEQFLREKTDQFELVAGKKIWTSIYNNIHPSKKWPSVSVCLLVLALLFMFGHLNAPENETRPGLQYAENKEQAKQKISPRPPGIPLKNESITSTEKNLPEIFEEPVSLKSNNSSAAYNPSRKEPEYAENRFNNAQKGLKTITGKQHPFHTTLVESKKSIRNPGSAFEKDLSGNNALNPIQRDLAVNLNAPDVLSDVATDIRKGKPAGLYTPGSRRIPGSVRPKNSNQETEPASGTQEDNSSQFYAKESDVRLSLKTDSASVVSNTVLTRPTQPDGGSPEEKGWIEDYALYGRKKSKPWKGKLEWQAHITPSVSYRTLKDNTPDKVRAAVSTDERNGSLNSDVRQKLSYGIEAGYALKYPLLKNLKVKIGAQLNYQQYTIDAFENHHPIGTSILLSDNETGNVLNVYKTTTLSNLNGVDAVQLHNNSFQFSIPIGIDARIAGDENLQWYAGANIQPAFVLSARNYLLSADRRYYVKDNSLLNKAGLYASLETYLSFSRGGYTWQLGPEFRTNLLSTNTRLYNVLERLNGFGLKAGVTKKF
jgi:hypothetical protein